MKKICFLCSCLWYYVCFFFFFQAEDGIRDVAVTGVQTCALPISDGRRLERSTTLVFTEPHRVTALNPGVYRVVEERSEEHTSELQSRLHLVCRLLLEKKKNQTVGYHDDRSEIRRR